MWKPWTNNSKQNVKDLPAWYGTLKDDSNKLLVSLFTLDYNNEQIIDLRTGNTFVTELLSSYCISKIRPTTGVVVDGFIACEEGAYPNDEENCIVTSFGPFVDPVQLHFGVFNLNKKDFWLTYVNAYMSQFFFPEQLFLYKPTPNRYLDLMP